MHICVSCNEKHKSIARCAATSFPDLLHTHRSTWCIVCPEWVITTFLLILTERFEKWSCPSCYSLDCPRGSQHHLFNIFINLSKFSPTKCNLQAYTCNLQAYKCNFQQTSNHSIPTYGIPSELYSTRLLLYFQQLILSLILFFYFSLAFHCSSFSHVYLKFSIHLII